MNIIIGLVAIAVVLIFLIVSPILACRIIREKGHDVSLWGLFGIAGGPLAVIAAACMKDKNGSSAGAIVTLVTASEEGISTVQSNIVKQRAVCPKCGASIEIDSATDFVECPTCGKKLTRKKQCKTSTNIKRLA